MSCCESDSEPEIKIEPPVIVKPEPKQEIVKPEPMQALVIKEVKNIQSILEPMQPDEIFGAQNYSCPKLIKAKL